MIQYRQATVDQFEGRVSVLRSMTTKEAVKNGNQVTRGGWLNGTWRGL